MKGKETMKAPKLNNRVLSLVSPIGDGSGGYRSLISDSVTIPINELGKSEMFVMKEVPISIRPTSLTVTPSDRYTRVQGYTGVYDQSNIKTKNEWLRMLGSTLPLSKRPSITIERKKNSIPIRGRVIEYRYVPNNGSSLVMETDRGITVIDADDISSFDIPMEYSEYTHPQKNPKELAVAVSSMNVDRMAKILMTYEVSGLSVHMQTTIKHEDKMLIEKCPFEKDVDILKSSRGLTSVLKSKAYPFVMVNNVSGESLSQVNVVRFPHMLSLNEYALNGSSRSHRTYESRKRTSYESVRSGYAENESGVDSIEDFQNPGSSLGDWTPDDGKPFIFERGRISRAMPSVPIYCANFPMISLMDEANSMPIDLYSYIKICPRYKLGAGIPPSTIAVITGNDDRIGESDLQTMIQPHGKDYAILKTSNFADITYTTKIHREYFRVEENREYSEKIVYKFRVNNNSPIDSYASVLLYLDTDDDFDHEQKILDEEPISVTITPEIKSSRAQVIKLDDNSILSPMRTSFGKRMWGGNRRLTRWVISLQDISNGGNATGYIMIYTKRT